MAKKNKRTIRSLGLKRTSNKNEYYDPKNRQLFYKDKKGILQMKIDPYDKQLHKQALQRIKYYEKKYKYSLTNLREYEKERYKKYKQAISDWNKGEISKVTTVASRYNPLNENLLNLSSYLSSENKLLETHIDEKKKVTYMRMMGQHGVNNGQAYTDFINTIADKLGLDFAYTESLLFPKNLAEKTKYEEIKPILNKSVSSIDEEVEKAVESGKITKNEKFHLSELINTGTRRYNI